MRISGSTRVQSLEEIHRVVYAAVVQRLRFTALEVHYTRWNSSGVAQSLLDALTGGRNQVEGMV